MCYSLIAEYIEEELKNTECNIIDVAILLSKKIDIQWTKDLYIDDNYKSEFIAMCYEKCELHKIKVTLYHIDNKVVILEQ